MVEFKKLRLVGFKSFVDPADLHISDGLTGVVGPNGCGKSNLVEALRWVMGETSAKQMRGAEMADVIFGGTAARAARNVAEVSVVLDNRDRRAPAAFNDLDELEVTRRIERGGGSVYRVNGKEVRARDVQLLFADAASGARSNAMVSQGRIGALIGAKPAQRRLILEEAAGITGLHSRRHEAELRLNAAQTNLERLDDVLVTLAGQIASLQKQARQAQRYRRLGDSIRKTEAALLHLRWQAAARRRDEARRLLVDGEATVRQLTASAAEAARRQAAAVAALPGLREAEATAAAGLQRLIIEREGLARDRQAAEAAIADLRRRRDQIAADIDRENALARDADGALAALVAERDTLRDAADGEDLHLEEARIRVAAVAESVSELEAQSDDIGRDLAEQEAQLRAIDGRLADLDARHARLLERRDEAVARLDDLEIDADFDVQIDEAEMMIEEAETALEARREALEDAGTAIAAARAQAAAARMAEADTRTALIDAEGAEARLGAEIQGLRAALAAGAEDHDRLIDSIRVAPGYEAAVAAALGEDLEAAPDPAAPVAWLPAAVAPDDPDLPGGAAPLAGQVRGADGLARRLAQIGVVDGTAEGEALWPALAVGQRLVSRDGGLWRWDGYRLRPGAPLAAARRFEQRNRLSALESAATSAAEAAAAAGARVDAAAQAVAAADAAVAAAEADEQQLRERLRDAGEQVERAREELAFFRREAAAAETRLAAARDGVARAEQDLAELAEQRAVLEAERQGLGDLAALKERHSSLRAALANRRADQMEAQAALTRLERDMSGRRRRLDTVEAEIGSWEARAQGAGDRVAALVARHEEVSIDLDIQEARPEELAERQAVLADQVALAEAARQEAADALAAADTRLRQADGALKQAEGKLAEAREGRVRAEAVLEQAEAHRQELLARIGERLACAPDQLAIVAELDLTQPLPEEEQVEHRLTRQMRERENMGAVNLRAEVELAELETQKQTLEAERDDLIAAIERLRGGIAQLNREARQRLMSAFSAVDTHFRDLFVRLFGGGRAHLELTESDDPLAAGLEIMASPPGKKLQNLSLLSGGEQALTAVALLFAVFMTNPAPICVLDEVDAPLDDANVDRFCRLLDDIGRQSATRFLIITHHRMTMARMDRLFGVTMAERGVSSLVSVDLHEAELYSRQEQRELFA